MSYEILRDKILRTNTMYLLKSSIVGIKCLEETENGRKRYSVDVLHGYIHDVGCKYNRIWFDTKEDQTKCVTDILNWLAPEPPTPSLLDI